MVNSQQGANGERRTRRRQKSHNELNGRDSGGAVTHEPDDLEVRRSRLERLDGSPIPSASTPKMTSESHATLPSPKSSHRRKRDQHRSPDEKKHRSRRKSTVKEGGTTAYVYGEPTRSRATPERKSGSDADSSSSDEDAVKVVKPKERKATVIYVTEEDDRAKRRQERRAKTREPAERSRETEESPRKTRTHRSRRKSMVESPPLRRSATTREPPSASRPTLKRSNTTSTKVTELKASASSATIGKRSSFIESLFGSAPKQPVEPERLIECLTCLSDDVPRSKSAKLKCGHRMCHSCLRRVFRLSITDPQHMPPKCCTTDHIPLKHVEKLFNIEFKKNWNRKFQEFSTKNRIYCPGKRCGEWIKPANIHKEDGRKFGKCSRCKTKVCCLCNGKWHGTKDCPKDEETNRLLAAAKEAGWQRCYSCRTMVELKEGCNHMTCHCTAEFCMCCGLKWKTCNCPWFNYDAVENDRLNHMQVPEEPAADRPNRLRRPRPPINFDDEMNERRRQERADEELARRLQRAIISDDEDDDYQGGIGDINGIGNGAGHFMNQNYVRAANNILTGRFDQATAAANYVMGVAQARGVPRPEAGPRPETGPRRMSGRYPVPPPGVQPPVMRRNSVRAQPNPEIPPIERVASGRRRRNEPENEAPVRAPSPAENARFAVLAGLGGRGGNRVDAWRSHVAVGAPEEGVLSI